MNEQRRIIIMKLTVLSGIFLPLLNSSLWCQTRGDIQMDSDIGIHYLVINPLGQRTGVDPRGSTDPEIGKKFKEIPNADYSTNSLGDSPISDEPPQPEDFSHEFMGRIFSPNDDGTYQIECFGLKLEKFSLYIGLDPRDPSMMQPFRVAVSGVIDSNNVVEYRWEYHGQPGTPITFEKVIESGTVDQDLTDLLKLNLITNHGIANSLQQKIDNAWKQKNKGQIKAASNMLQAFINEVNAQEGKAITKDAANILLSDAQQLLKEWNK